MEQVIISRSKLSKYYLVIGILLVCLFILPYIILGQDSMLRIHDTLDGQFSNLVAVARSGHAFKLDVKLNNIMNGLPRSSFVSPFYVVQWLFIFFSPFTAFVIDAFIMHLVAFIGMFLLLKTHFLQSEERIWVVFGCSMAFALLPHMPFFGLSVAGQPLLLYAFLNLRNKQRQLINYVIILIFPFYSYLVSSGVFIICGLSIVLALDTLTHKQVNKQFLLGLLILIVGYGAAEYNLIADFFFNKKFISHRTEWNLYLGGYSFKTAIEAAFSNFIHADNQAYSLHTPILLFSSAAIISVVSKKNFIREHKKIFLIAFSAAFGLALLLLLYIRSGLMPLAQIREMYYAGRSIPIMNSLLLLLHNYKFFKILSSCLLFFSLIIFAVCIVIVFLASKKNILMEQDSKLLPLLFLTAFGISLFHGFYYWAGLIPVKEKIPFLKMFHLDRFFFLHPLIWYLIFALSLSIIYKTKHGKNLVLIFIVFQIYYVLINNNEANNLWQSNAKAAYYKITGMSLDANALTYKNFFSENLYKEIKDYIAVPQRDYRVVSIGLYPSIATYNGFYTLDACINNYPLEYKHKFRKIIENELNKSKKWQEYFDYWGHRCYVFVAELENLWFENTKETIKKINNLDLNTKQLKAMGGKYIFSAFEIVNAVHNKLILLKVFERNDSPWRIYLYKVQ